MKIKILLCSFFLLGMFGISACKSENKELKKDAKEIADVMCKTMEAMKNLKSVNAGDSIQVEKLQLDYSKVQEEMAVLYQKFNAKYGEKTGTREFKEDFRKYLNESMLECKSLSKEDRAAFEKGAE
jgi:hypothetical protein